MKRRPLLPLCSAASRLPAVGVRRGQMPRVFVLTDIENEPDDAMSMVRFLTYANHFDIEGLVATTSIHQRTKTRRMAIREIVEAYGKVQRQPQPPRARLPHGSAPVAFVIRGPARLRHGRRGRGPRLARLGDAHPRRRPRRSAAVVGAGVGRTQRARAGALENSRHAVPRRPGEAVAQAPRVHHLRSGRLRAVAAKGPFPSCSTSRAPASTRAAPTTSPRGAASAAIGFTPAAPAPISRSSTTNGSTATSAKRARSAPSIPLGVPDGGRYPSFLGLVRNGLNARTSRLGRLGRPLRTLHPAPAKWHLEPETRPFWTDAVDEVLGVDGNWHTTNHATIWRWRAGVPARLRRAHGLDDKAYQGRQPPARAPKLGHAATPHREEGRHDRPQRRGHDRSRRRRAVVRMVLLHEAGTFPPPTRAPGSRSRSGTSISPKRGSPCRPAA
jgi:hypothetical protein